MADGLRLDVALVARSTLASRRRRPMAALHDPDGTLVGLEFASPRSEPTPEWLSSHVSDFLRFLDQLNVVVVRREWIAGVDNAWYLISRLLDLYAHSNRAPRTSPRRVNERLTPAQQRAVESLPPIQANEVSVVECQSLDLRCEGMRQRSCTVSGGAVTRQTVTVAEGVATRDASTSYAAPTYRASTRWSTPRAA